MASAPVQIIGAWLDADEAPGVGFVTFQRHDVIQDPSVAIYAQVETVALADGAIDTAVVGVDPSDPNPLAHVYRVTERIRWAERAVEYDIVVEAGMGPIDLATVERVDAPSATLPPGYEPLGSVAVERARAIAAEDALQVAIDNIETGTVDLSGYAALAQPNVFTEPQSIAVANELLEDFGGPVTNLVLLRDGSDVVARFLSIFFAPFPGFDIKQTALAFAEWNPLAGAYTGRIGALTYGLVAVDDSGPVYRFTGRVSPVSTLGEFLSGELGVLQSGTPTQPADVARKGEVDAVAADVAAVWQPVLPAEPSHQTLQQDLIDNANANWVVDPTVASSHQLYVTVDQDIFIEVPNPGPGKFAKLAVTIVNVSGGAPNVRVVDPTSGAPTGQLHAEVGSATVFAIDIYGGPTDGDTPGPTIRWAYRLN